jgi:hypothetical protein
MPDVAPHRARVACLLLSLFAAPLAAQSTHDILQSDYRKAREAALFDAGQDHLELGSWARKHGLVPQATTEFLRAVEVSEGKNAGAQQVLGIMRGLGDAFWRGEPKHPAKATVADYGHRAAALELHTRKARIDLAQRAARAGMPDESREQWLAVLRLGGKLEYDDKDAPRIDGVAVPAELAGWLQEQTTKVDGRRTFEPGGAKAPRVGGMHEAANDLLIVRTDLDEERGKALLALGTALWPALQERLDGAPTRRLALLVFAHKSDYDAYLDVRGLGVLKAARGAADYGNGQTLICGDGLGDPELHAIALHELSHLFFYGTAPAFLPDWYAEGFAETFGGQGTFTWDGKALQTGGLLDRGRLDDLRKAPLPLRELLAADAAKLLATDHDKGLRFYAEAWALQRFLRGEKTPWQAKFRQWEAQCRCLVLGAPQGSAPQGNAQLSGRFGDPSQAQVQFERLFGPDLDELETAFRDWLAKL